jgi:hypothetical protein
VDRDIDIGRESIPSFFHRERNVCLLSLPPVHNIKRKRVIANLYLRANIGSSSSPLNKAM